ncbi:MAG: hypothetical protein U9Q06_00780 [Nanoarchaeota archaeon]|nr:hypothetical protein [Nanoarchaeota archaeon]
MKKKAYELTKGDKVKIIDKVWIVENIENSDIGKQGSKKTRLELKSDQEKITIIRPAEYPFEVI